MGSILFLYERGSQGAGDREISLLPVPPIPFSCFAYGKQTGDRGKFRNESLTNYGESDSYLLIHHFFVRWEKNKKKQKSCS